MCPHQTMEAQQSFLVPGSLVQIPEPTIHIGLTSERRIQLATQKLLGDITKYLLRLTAIISMVTHLAIVEALSLH